MKLKVFYEPYEGKENTRPSPTGLLYLGAIDLVYPHLLLRLSFQIRIVSYDCLLTYLGQEILRTRWKDL